MLIGAIIQAKPQPLAKANNGKISETRQKKNRWQLNFSRIQAEKSKKKRNRSDATNTAKNL
jgi:hypothetical protein